WTNCGKSPDVARMRGCLFHPMLAAWVPPECSALELGIEGKNDPYTGREWFLDENKTQLADMDRLRSGDGPLVFTENSYHIEHCVYVWKAFSKAVESRRGLVNSKSGNANHTNHCADMIV
ncbi:hypothetical protein N431DRAFT_310462, partial [Stipitochalara longipes BDJ]